MPPPEGEVSVWPFYLGDASRARVHDNSIAPPLELLWHRRLGSGIGLSGVYRNGIVAIPTAKGEVHFLRITDGKRVGQVKYAKTALSILWPTPSSLVVAAKTGGLPLACYDLQAATWRWRTGKGLLDSEPLALGDTIFVAFTFGKARAYSLTDGSLFWETDVKEQVHASPCGVSDLLILGTDDGHLIALHRSSGRVSWKIRIGRTILATPVAEDSLIFAGTMDSLVACVRAKDGQVLWKRRVPGRVRVAASVVPRAQMALFTTSSHCVLALSSADGRELWKAELAAAAGVPPLVAGSVVWVGALNRKLYALDLRSGEVRWSTDLKGAVRSALLPAGNILIVCSEDYHVYAFCGAGGSAN